MYYAINISYYKDVHCCAWDTINKNCANANQ